jgi:phosphotransacetylase
VKKPSKTDDKDEWEEEDTILDEYQRQKELEEASVNKSLTREDFADMIAQQSGPSFGVCGAIQRVSSTNDYIAKALERNPNGWMITSINQMMNNDLNIHGFQIPRPNPEAEVNIRVSDPQLIATLHHAMQGYC